MPRGVYDRKKTNAKPEETVTDETTEQPDLRTDMEREADEQAAKAREELANGGGDPIPPEGELCGQCWPEGWQGDQDAAECSHGAWTR